MPDWQAPALPKQRQRRRPHLVVTISAETLAGWDDLPANLTSYGAITAQAARDLAKQCGTADLLILGPQPGNDTGTAENDAENGDENGDGSPRKPVPPGTYEPAIRQKQQFGTPPQTGYRPHNALVREIIARYQTCRFPGCPRPAEQCDLDHVIPYPEGQTTPDNLVPICRRHHILKTHGGWTLTPAAPSDGPDGTVRWTSPNGRTYLTPPPDHPGLAS